MKIYKAIKDSMMGQPYDAVPWMLEAYKKLKMSNHGGYDFGAKTGDPVYYDCDVDGYILNTEIDNSGGLGVNIITESEEGIFKHRYWHLKDFFVKAGDKISIGECIGWADNTGFSTGTHLHRDIKEMIKNPNGSLSVKYPNNGTFGTIRYMNDAVEGETAKDWFENKFVLDVVGQDKKQSYLRKLLIAMINKLLKK
jgi:murein DD-endopeptidase MepM/ murein hydrolase activator NlpD